MSRPDIPVVNRAMERGYIRAHLIKRGWNPNLMPLEHRITCIQERIHRNRPITRAHKPTVRKPPVIFATDELAYIAAHFAGANHPLAQSIYMKAIR